MKIMIGVDGSPHSRAAVDCVRRMTWPAGSTIQVLSVARPAVAVAAEAFVPPATFVGEIYTEAVRFHQEIAAGVERDLQGTGLDTEAMVMNGDPRIELVEAARAWDADLVVLGSHGRTGLARLLMGSVAAYVVAHAPCSVLVVKLKETHATRRVTGRHVP